MTRYEKYRAAQEDRYCYFLARLGEDREAEAFSKAGLTATTNTNRSKMILRIMEKPENIKKYREYKRQIEEEDIAVRRKAEDNKISKETLMRDLQEVMQAAKEATVYDDENGTRTFDFRNAAAYTKLADTAAKMVGAYEAEKSESKVTIGFEGGGGDFDELSK